ncbi:hypothetical protein [Microcoleus sp. bin38.metabat.b11b12b14.051]|uniref:hypothetical protein n=1 Tax=Microcoleus sp. bin38.metabat.b11b12b14.051 TaxID=2742709 RepID=UPI0025D20248|nr:hypothetical protein [Microcoleus sp. bin38.metabat.b11b12b14.051]
MLIFPAETEAVAIGLTIFWILPPPTSARILHRAEFLVFSLFPLPGFSKDFIFLTFLNNSA